MHTIAHAASLRHLAVAAWLACALLAGAAVAAAAEPAKIVLIGGRKSHDPGEHDFPNAIVMLGAWLTASPTFAGAEVWTYSTGWPADPAALDGTTTLLLYFDGVQEKPEPLLAPERLAQLRTLMAAGAGLVCLHQASTVPAGDTTIPLGEWLGARRDGMVDRCTATVSLAPASPQHPISRGMGAMTYRDEFYPTLVFNPDAARLTPILRAPLPPEAPADRVLAWAFERQGGGRSFGFTGGHYLAAFSEPGIRTMLLNALAWTSGLEVPAAGVALRTPVVGVSVVSRPQDNKVLPMPWGELTWVTSAELHNSHTMTTGIAVVHPGKSNPRHFHPNCDEVLRVVSGRIRHTMNDVTVEMGPGDSVSIPQGTLHNATNIGTENAVLAISFSSAFRQVVGE